MAARLQTGQRAESCRTVQKLIVPEGWEGRLLVRYHVPLEDALAAFVRFELAGKRLASACVRAPAPLEFYPGSEKALAAIDACVEFAFEAKRSLDQSYWTQARDRSVEAALAVASKPDVKNAEVLRQRGGH